MTRRRIEIDELVEDLEDLFDDSVAAMKAVADGFVDRLERTHRQGKDPYGGRWKPRKQQQAWPILNRTGRMLKAYDAKPGRKDSVVTISNRAAYAVHVNEERQLVPDERRGLPDRWVEDLEAALDEFVRKKF